MSVYDGIMQGLEEAVAYNKGKIKARTQTISISPVPDFEAGEIKNIRTELGMTQVLFAGFMGVSSKTVGRLGAICRTDRHEGSCPCCRPIRICRSDSIS